MTPCIRKQNNNIKETYAIARREINFTGLNRVIQCWLDENQALEPGYEVSTVHISVRAKPVPSIDICHEDGTQYLPRLRKKLKPNAGVIPASDRSLGLKRLRLIPGLTSRTVDILDEAGVRTVASVRKMTLEEVMAIEGVTRPRAKNLKKALTDFGVELDWDL